MGWSFKDYWERWGERVLDKSKGDDMHLASLVWHDAIKQLLEQGVSLRIAGEEFRSAPLRKLNQLKDENEQELAIRKVLSNQSLKHDVELTCPECFRNMLLQPDSTKHSYPVPVSGELRLVLSYNNDPLCSHCLVAPRMRVLGDT